MAVVIIIIVSIDTNNVIVLFQENLVNVFIMILIIIDGIYGDDLP